MSVAIRGLGTWLPDTIRTNDAWPESFARNAYAQGGDRTFNDIPRADDPESAAILEEYLAAEARDPFLGATQRRIASDAVSSADAETLAARAALADARVDASEVDIVLSNSAVLDRVLPSTAVLVAHRVGASRALAQGMESACASGLTQLEMARAYIESGLAHTVLLTQSHLLWRTLEPMHPASPGLGDVATAMVVAREGKLAVRSTFATTHGEFADAVTWVRGRNDETDLPWWKSGGDFHLSSRNPKQVKQLMRDTVSFGAQTIREALARAHADVVQIRAIASVQPRGFIPIAIAKRLGLLPEVAVTTYDRIAHVGACGPVMNLVETLKTKNLSAGAIVALYAQGAGFTRASAVLEFVG